MASPAGTGICRLIVTNFIHGGDVDDDDDDNGDGDDDDDDGRIY